MREVGGLCLGLTDYIDIVWGEAAREALASYPRRCCSSAQRAADAPPSVRDEVRL